MLVAIGFASGIPQVWDEKELVGWALPLAGLNLPPTHYTAREYYAAPLANLRTYPVYYPGREPSGYWDFILRRSPEKLVPGERSREDEDWIRLGRRVFEELDFPPFRSADPRLIEQIRSLDHVTALGVEPQPDGTIFGIRWVVTPKGIQLGISECAFCHAGHVAGKIVHGIPRDSRGNAFTARLVSEGNSRLHLGEPLSMILYRNFAVPWRPSDVHESLKHLSHAELLKLVRSSSPGIAVRRNGSPFHPTKIPDLVGIRDRKYLDHTATHRHRGIGDLMRYAAWITGSDPSDFGPHRMLTDQQRRVSFRYPDELLYALARYIYSLEPPANPNPRGAQAAAGEAIFRRERCVECHTPPLYTNNKLTLAQGFVPPAQHLKSLDIMQVSVGTDPGLAMETRKGTGYYKVPSLRGVWYRRRFLHDGSLTSLEEVFNPERLNTGQRLRGSGVEHAVATRPVPGHPFGLSLRQEERAQLLAFLRTL